MNKIDIADFNFDYREPMVFTAIHNGHHLSEQIAANIVLTESERLYEEDPYTGMFTEISGNRAVVNISRFQADLNRPVERSFYVTPAQAWGLKVRKSVPNAREISISRDCYDWWYQNISIYLEKMLKIHPRIFVFDLHSYNHRRKGPDAEFDDPEFNPEIIIGTNNMPSDWLPIADIITSKLRTADYFGRGLDVRQNVKFDGGYFSRWLHDRFSGRVGCIALEFKKIFMNEWTGEIDMEKASRLREILSETKAPIIDFCHSNR